MRLAKRGNTVKIQYTCKSKDGAVLDASTEGEPLQFTIGKHQVIRGIEEAVVGMSQGESKTIEVPVGKAYGRYRKESVMVMDRDRFPEHVAPKIGQELEIYHASGGKTVVRVLEVSEGKVMLDGNHPLAGKNLTFDIRLVEFV